LMDARQGKTDMVRHITRKAHAKDGAVIAMHTSPNCQRHPIAQRLEEAQHRSTHAATLVQEEEMVRMLVGSILKECRRNPKFSFTIENPRGSALAEDPMMQLLGQPVEVRMCSYGYLWCKPTWIWTNLYPRYWRPRPFETCRYCATNTKHPHRIIRRDEHDNRPPPQIPGFTVEAAKNRIHPDLAQEWGEAMIAHAQEN